MGVNSLPKTVTRQRRDCDLNPSASAPESSTLTTRLPSHSTVIKTNTQYTRSSGVSAVHTHTQPFNGPLSGTTRGSWYQKGKNEPGFY